MEKMPFTPWAGYRAINRCEERAELGVEPRYASKSWVIS